MSRAVAAAPVNAKTDSSHSPAPPQRAQLEPVADTSPKGLQGGAALPPTLRERMEASFGEPFEGIRVHADAGAAELAGSEQAEAVTEGEHIAFGTGWYRPDTPAGDRLVAHELAHVVQQRHEGGGATESRGTSSHPGEPAERAAETAAETAIAGGRVESVGPAYSTRNRLMRRALANPAAPPNPAPLQSIGGPSPAHKRRRPQPAPTAVAEGARQTASATEAAKREDEASGTAPPAATPKERPPESAGEAPAKPREVPEHPGLPGARQEEEAPAAAGPAPEAQTRPAEPAPEAQAAAPEQADSDAAPPPPSSPLPHTHDAGDQAAAAAEAEQRGPATEAEGTSEPQQEPAQEGEAGGTAGGAQAEGLGAGGPGAGAAGPEAAVGGAPIGAGPQQAEAGGAEIPGDVGPEIRGLLSSMQASLEASRQSIRSSALVQKLALNAGAEQAKTRVSGVIAGLGAEVNASVTEKVSSAETGYASARSRVTAAHQSSAAASEETHAASQEEADREIGAASDSVQTAGDTASASMQAYGETKAGEAETASTANAAAAENKGREAARRYSDDDAGDEGSAGSRQHGQEMAAGIREQGAAIAESAQGKGGVLAGDLEEGAAMVVNALTDTVQPAIDAGLGLMGSSASGALDQVEQDSEPVQRGIVDQAIAMFTSTGAAILNGLSSLAIRFAGLVDLGRDKGSAALDLAADERIAGIDVVEAQVMQEFAGVPADPTGELAEALAEIEVAGAEEAASSAEEIDAGGAEMIGELNSGGELGEQSANYLGGVGANALDDMQSEAERGLEDSGDQAEGSFEQIVNDISQAFHEAVTCVLGYLIPATQDALDAIGLGAEEGEQQIDQAVDPALAEQEEELTSLAEYLFDEWEQTIREGGILGTLALLVVAVVGIVEAFVGIIVGLLEAVLNFVVGLVLLVVGIVVALFTIGFIAGMLLVFVTICVGPVTAVVVAALFIVVALVVLIIGVVLALVAGILFILYSIVMNIVTALTSSDPRLGPFERGRLIGLAIGDILLLLLPLKAKIKIRAPAWLTRWLEGVRPIAAILVRLLRLCEFDAVLLLRLIRLIRNLERLEAVLTGVIEAGGRARTLATVLEAAIRETAVFDRLLVLAENNPAMLVELVNLVKGDAALLVRMVMDAADLEGLVGLLRALARDGIEIERIGRLIEGGAQTMRTLQIIRRTGAAGLEIIEALVGRGLEAADAVRTVELAEGLGVLTEVGELARSPNFTNPGVLPLFLESMKGGRRGNRVTFNEVVSRVRAGHRVAMEEAGVDIIDLTERAVFESKEITSRSNDKFRSEVNEAAGQLRAANGQQLEGMARVIRLDLRSNSRLQAADRATVRAEFAARTNLEGVNRVDVVNNHPDSPFVFTVDPATGTVAP